MLEQRPFSLQTPAVTAGAAVAANHTVAGHDERYRVARAGPRYRANGFRLAEDLRDLRVRARFAVGNRL